MPRLDLEALDAEPEVERNEMCLTREHYRESCFLCECLEDCHPDWVKWDARRSIEDPHVQHRTRVRLLAPGLESETDVGDHDDNE